MATGLPTLLNKDVFVKDPTQESIPNLGVAKVQEPDTPEAWNVLAYELSSFVCEGEYELGMERVLSTFLGSLDKPQQPAVWVSGFYGSGKSHFARVLEFLWRNPVFPDGQMARSKVSLPGSIQNHLTELTIAGRRYGGLWSAAGTLGASAGDTVRLAMLGIVFRSAGLPSQYGRGRFALWLHQNGAYDALKAEVEAQGKSFDHETQHMFVSTVLHRALLTVMPDFAATTTEVASKLRAQFPSAPADIGDDDLLESLEAVLALKAAEGGQPGKRPLTLIIFDELQQFIGEDPARTLQVQQVVEACSARFGGSLLFLATGQAQLQATPQLQKLQGRFTVRVMLSNTDVERVVRQVVLRKKPDRMPEIEATLDRASGEVSRHLTESRIGATSADRPDLVPDYPLLPTRRRFWEATLRAVDTAGTAGQLRTQLKIVQDATRDVALRPVGHVIGGDVIFDQLKPDMLQSGVLLGEINEFIADLAKDGPDGRLRARLCATIFLIGWLPTSGIAETGLLATAGNLADLLVEDLTAGSAELRGKIPVLLEGLVETGKLMLVDDEYWLQTREGMVWEQIFSERTGKILSDDARLADERTQLVRSLVEKELKRLSLVQGTSKTPRDFDIHFGLDEPAAGSGKAPVWVRDEWSVTEKAVREAAQIAGTDSPVVFVFLPRRDADALKTAIARTEAAGETLNEKGLPTSDEGREARTAMLSRQAAEQEKRDRLIANVVHAAKVFQGGGSEVGEGSLRASAEAATRASLARLFPRFATGDHPNWGRVVTRAVEGAPDPLAQVGFTGDAADEPVCREVRLFVGGAGRKGSEVRERFRNPPYGWPQDAVDGALLALVGAGQIRAARNGQPQTTKTLNKQQIPGVDFVGEEELVSKMQLIGLRGLLGDLGMPVKTDDEARATTPVMLKQLVALAAEAGGEAPLPSPPTTLYLADLQALTGNGQVLGVLGAKEEILRDFRAWTTAKARIANRLPRWRMLHRFLNHAGDLEALRALRPQVEAVGVNRALLEEPDPLIPLHAAVATALREAVSGARHQVATTRTDELARLKDTPEWTTVSDTEWEQIFAANNLGLLPAIEVGTDEALLRSLDAFPLVYWESQLEAQPARIGKARDAAARMLEPKAEKVQPKAAMLTTAAEVEVYLDGLRTDIMAHVGRGVAVIV